MGELGRSSVLKMPSIRVSRQAMRRDEWKKQPVFKLAPESPPTPVFSASRVSGFFRHFSPYVTDFKRGQRRKSDIIPFLKLSFQKALTRCRESKYTCFN